MSTARNMALVFMSNEMAAVLAVIAGANALMLIIRWRLGWGYAAPELLVTRSMASLAVFYVYSILVAGLLNPSTLLARGLFRMAIMLVLAGELANNLAVFWLVFKGRRLNKESKGNDTQ